MTTSKLKMALCAAALILPTLVLGGTAWQRMVELDSAPTVRLPIQGYDPVHILHGHYIRLSFDDRSFGPAREPNNYYAYKDLDCVCFHPNAPQSNPKSALPLLADYVQCSKKAELSCEMWATKADFFRRPQKFFVDERYASKLDSLVREATRRPSRPVVKKDAPTPPPEPEAPPRVTMDVAVAPSGALRLKMLYIDGKPWRDVVATTP